MGPLATPIKLWTDALNTRSCQQATERTFTRKNSGSGPEDQQPTHLTEVERRDYSVTPVGWMESCLGGGGVKELTVTNWSNASSLEDGSFDSRRVHQ
jgi:hypothetical protein